MASTVRGAVDALRQFVKENEGRSFQSEILNLTRCRHDFFNRQTDRPLGHVLIIWPGDTAATTYEPERFSSRSPAWHSEDELKFDYLWLNGSRIQPNHACTHWMEPTTFHRFGEFSDCAKMAVQTIVDWGEIGESILSEPSNVAQFAISERWLFTLHNQLDADASNLYDKEPVQLWHYGDPKEVETEKAKRKEELEGATISRFRDVFSASIQFIDQLLQEFSGKPVAPDSGDVLAFDHECKVKKPKRSTERGEGRAKLISALTEHHKYAEGGCLNWEPVGNNELAGIAGVVQSTASAFFKKEFESHTKYKQFCHREANLIAKLMSLNGETIPPELFNPLPDEHADAEPDDDGDE